MPKLLKIAVSSVVIATVLGGIALFVAGQSQAADGGRVEARRHKDTDVTWSPATLSFSVKPGETQQLPVTFTARENIDENTVIYASTSLKDIASVTPTTIGPLKKGQTGTITVVVKLPILQSAGTITGFIQLYDNDKRNGRRPERAGMPLLISVAIMCPCLPPDPGEAGKVTLQGVDSDNDGVRDDVQRYIAATFPQSAKIRAALTQDATYIQTLVVGGGTLGTNMQASDDAVACEAFTFKTSDADFQGELRAIDSYRALKAAVLNTGDRIKVFGASNKQFDGMQSVSIPYNQSAPHCRVAPSTLPN